MDYITCSSCGKETEESDFFGNKKEKCSWCDELLKVKKGTPEQDNPNDKELKNDMKRKRLGHTFWCVLGIIMGLGFTIKGTGEIIGPIIILFNIWLIYKIYKGELDDFPK